MGRIRCGELDAHLLDLHCLLFELRRENVNLFLLFLVPAVLFEELVEQHRVHCVVAHGVNFTSASRPSFARLVVVAGGAEKLVASRLQKTAVS